MNDKSLWRKICFPPIWMIMLLMVFSTGALIMVFINGWDTMPFAYIVYVVAFYTLIIFSLACWKTFPGYIRNIKEKVYRNQYANRYFTDVMFKTHVTLYRSLCINLVYVFVNAVSAILYRSYWFAVFAVYYGTMAVMRFLLVRYVNRNGIGENYLGELKRARFCAGILLTINLALSGVVLMMVYFDRGFEYQGFLIYLMALYTFYCTTIAIVEMVKYRRYKSPVMSVSKVIKLAASLFSMLFLETAMFAQFGGDTPGETKQVMIMATGAGISIIVVATAVFMIVRTTGEIKEIRSKNKNGE